MISRYTYHDLLWVDIESPTHEEVRAIMSEFDIHPIVADELLTPSLRPKIDRYENYLYLILHFPALRHSHTTKTQEVDFVIGKKFIITVRYELLDPMHKFAKVFEVNRILDKRDMGDHAGFVFFYMIRKIYASLTHELEVISESLERIEDRIFLGEERAMVAEISKSYRDILLFHRALRMHKSVLTSLESACEDFFGKDFRHYAQNITGEYLKVEEILSDQKEILGDLRATNASLLTTKTNEIMKVLTATNFMLLPATLIIQIFSLPSAHKPIMGMVNDFWIVLVLVLLMVTTTFMIFKWKRWI